MDNKKPEPKYIRGKYTPAQGKANEKYRKANNDEIKIRVKKGQKDEYKALAESVGMTLNGFITAAMEMLAEQIKKEKNSDSGE